MPRKTSRKRKTSENHSEEVITLETARRKMIEEMNVER